MTPTSYYRGHSIYYDYETEKWYYKDDDKYIKSENRPCARCGKTPTLNGADYCLKDLEVCDFINAACCGHGERIGYISLQDGRIFREIDSSDILFKMSRLENENKKLKEENEKLIQKKCLPCELVNLQTREIDKLKEENEQLKHQIEIEKKWQLEKDRYYVKIKEENDQLRRLFEEMKQPITINLTEEDEKELRKLLGLIDDE